MNKDELATVNGLEEQARKLKVLLVGEFEVLKLENKQLKKSVK